MASSPRQHPLPRRRYRVLHEVAPASDPQRSSWQVATNLVKSFQYAGMGLLYALRTQRNFRIHLVIAALALSLCGAFRLSSVEVALIGVTCGLVLVLELLNTALEAVVDLTVGREYHILARIAKDCAAAAVLVGAIVALGVAALLLLPPLWAWGMKWIESRVGAG